jgi:putative transposase
MARKLRVEYPGAIYHVLNRGNYRRDLFVNPGEAQAFVTALEEATLRFGWKVYAYAVMRNHYHLAIETPQPNLKAGMHWLQSTYATRFNRLHRERGHLFQGRYHSLLVEDDVHLARLVDYIHLNPVRAGIVGAEQAERFRWSSLGRFVRGDRFAGMEAGSWLRVRDCADDADGWQRYCGHLSGLARDPEEQKRCGFTGMSQGWCIGTEGWRQAVAKDHQQMALNPGLAAAEVKLLQQSRWSEALEQALAQTKRTPAEVKLGLKSAPWKLALAARLRDETGASIAWIASELCMGQPGSLRSKLSLYRKQQNSA